MRICCAAAAAYHHRLTATPTHLHYPDSGTGDNAALRLPWALANESALRKKKRFARAGGPISAGQQPRRTETQVIALLWSRSRQRRSLPAFWPRNSGYIPHIRLSRHLICRGARGVHARRTALRILHFLRSFSSITSPRPLPARPKIDDPSSLPSCD